MRRRGAGRNARHQFQRRTMMPNYAAASAHPLNMMPVPIGGPHQGRAPLLVTRRFICPAQAIQFVTGPEGRHIRQVEEENVQVMVDQLSLIQRLPYVPITLTGSDSDVLRAEERFARCLMNYVPSRDPTARQHHNNTASGSSRPYHRPRSASVTSHRNTRGSERHRYPSPTRSHARRRHEDSHDGDIINIHPSPSISEDDDPNGPSVVPDP